MYQTNPAPIMILPGREAPAGLSLATCLSALGLARLTSDVYAAGEGTGETGGRRPDPGVWAGGMVSQKRR